VDGCARSLLFVTALSASRIEDKAHEKTSARQAAPIWQVGRSMLPNLEDIAEHHFFSAGPQPPPAKARLKCDRNLPAEEASADSEPQLSHNQNVEERV
jgi:hypothetical protein